MWRWEIDLDRLDWSPNLELIHRRPPGEFDGRFASFAEDIHPDDRERVRQAIAAAINGHGEYEVQYRLPRREGLTEIWIEARGKVEFVDGRAASMSGICHDVTAHKKIELELADRLRQQEAVAEFGRLAFEADGLQGVLDHAVELLADTLGVDYAKVLEFRPADGEFLLRAGVGWKPGLVGHATVGAGNDSQAGYTVMSGTAIVVTDLGRESRFNGPPLLHEHGVVSGMSAPIVGPDGSPYGVVGVHTAVARAFTQYDVFFLRSVASILAGAVQKAHGETLHDLLFRDLQHRISNLFGQVLSIHRQTAMTCDTIEELGDKFERRLIAASQAHRMISERGWTATSLETMISALLRPHAERLTLSGPPASMPADAAFAFSLAINELTTNAAKYGCFVDGDGALEVRWSLDDGPARHLTLDWNETCTHQVTPPDRESFGSRLVDMVVVQQLQGEISRDYAADGLKVRISFDLEHPSMGSPETTAQPAAE